MIRKAVTMEPKPMNPFSVFWNIDVRNSMLLGTTILVGITGTGCNRPDREWTGDSKVPSETKASLSVVDRVSAGPVPRKSMQLYSLQPGRVEPYEQTPILSKTSGYVESVAVDLGDKVHKGDTLIQLRAPEYQYQVAIKLGAIEQYEAQIEQAEAALGASQAAERSALAMVQEVQARIERAEAQYQRWKSESARTRELVAAGAVTEKLADETLSQFQAAAAVRNEIAASIESQRAKLLEAQAHVGQAQADLKAAHAKLSVAHSEHAQSLTMVEYLTLKAPFDGVVTSRSVDAGHYVQPAGSSNATPLLTVVNSQRVRVLVDLPESEAFYVNADTFQGNQGDSVELLLPAQPGKRIAGRITRTSASLDAESRSLSTQIELDNSEGKLLMGGFVQAKILLEEKKDAWALPIGAVVRKNEEAYCCLVVDGKIEFRPIQTGLRVADEFEIVSGLVGTETVVLARAGGFKAGQSVEVLVKK
ncbi:MAG: efflux RND transporter periplasmic adaptor subunit [Planctomycetota bacterium]|nr:MAG: efflux RND transporter periplasmic adaptor subunit [Planctomycetota bacterium]